MSNNDEFLTVRRNQLISEFSEEIKLLENAIKHAEKSLPFDTKKQKHYKIKRLSVLHDKHTKVKFQLSTLSNNNKKMPAVVYYTNTHESLTITLGGKCHCCGTTNNLEIDHRYNDGFYDRTYDRHHHHTDTWHKYTQDKSLAKSQLQLLCVTCHKYKHLITGYGNAIFHLMRNLDGVSQKQVYSTMKSILTHYVTEPKYATNILRHTHLFD